MSVMVSAGGHDVEGAIGAMLAALTPHVDDDWSVRAGWSPGLALGDVRRGRFRGNGCR